MLFKVEKVDSVLLPGGWRKRWKVSCDNNDLPDETWIAGVGATFGPIDRFLCSIVDGIAKVQCFRHNGQVEYTLFPQINCNVTFPSECLVTVGVSQPGEGFPAISVSPNPFSDQLTVLFQGAVPRDIHLTLFDLAGREKIIQNQLTDNTLQIERGGVPPGVYFLILKSADWQGRPAVWKVVAE